MFKLVEWCQKLVQHKAGELSDAEVNRMNKEKWRHFVAGVSSGMTFISIAVSVFNAK